MSPVPGQDFPNETALEDLRDRLQDELSSLQEQLDRLHRLFAERQTRLREPEVRPGRLLPQRRRNAGRRG